MHKTPSTPREALAQLRELYGRCAVGNLTFTKADISQEAKRIIEAEYAEGFRLWWTSWVAPMLDILEARLPKRKKDQDGPPRCKECGGYEIDCNHD